MNMIKLIYSRIANGEEKEIEIHIFNKDKKHFYIILYKI